jgi:hypothetical protein
MNRSYSKIRHIQEANKRLENKLLLEKIGDSLTPEAAGSPKAKDTKFVAQFLNSHYKINLPAAQTGNWSDKDYNDTLKKYMKEKQIPVWICKKGDGYCHDDSEGEVTAKGSDLDKLYDSMKPNNSPVEQGKINTTFDKAYDYKLENGKYYFKGKENTQHTKKYPNWVEATGKGLEAIKSKVTFT